MYLAILRWGVHLGMRSPSHNEAHPEWCRCGLKLKGLPRRLKNEAQIKEHRGGNAKGGRMGRGLKTLWGRWAAACSTGLFKKDVEIRFLKCTAASMFQIGSISGEGATAGGRTPRNRLSRPAHVCGRKGCPFPQMGQWQRATPHLETEFEGGRLWMSNLKAGNAKFIVVIASDSCSDNEPEDEQE